MINNMEEFPDRKIFASDSPIRRCTKCRKVLTRDKFYKIRSTLSGLDNYCKVCRKISAAGNRGRFADPYRFVKPAKIIIAKGNLACICCGNKNVDWLQIDHIIPVKGKRKGSHTSTIARKIISEELSSDEFQLLCANCNFAKKDLEKCPIDHSLD
jgi:hypothetical protein